MSLRPTLFDTVPYFSATTGTPRDITERCSHCGNNFVRADRPVETSHAVTLVTDVQGRIVLPTWDSSTEGPVGSSKLDSLPTVRSVYGSSAWELWHRLRSHLAHILPPTRAATCLVASSTLPLGDSSDSAQSTVQPVWLFVTLSVVRPSFPSAAQPSYIYEWREATPSLLGQLHNTLLQAAWRVCIASPASIEPAVVDPATTPPPSLSSSPSLSCCTNISSLSLAHSICRLSLQTASQVEALQPGLVCLPFLSYSTTHDVTPSCLHQTDLANNPRVSGHAHWYHLSSKLRFSKDTPTIPEGSAPPILALNDPIKRAELFSLLAMNNTTGDDVELPQETLPPSLACRALGCQISSWESLPSPQTSWFRRLSQFCQRYGYSGPWLLPAASHVTLPRAHYPVCPSPTSDPSDLVTLANWFVIFHVAPSSHRKPSLPPNHNKRGAWLGEADRNPPHAETCSAPSSTTDPLGFLPCFPAMTPSQLLQQLQPFAEAHQHLCHRDPASYAQAFGQLAVNSRVQTAVPSGQPLSIPNPLPVPSDFRIDPWAKITMDYLDTVGQHLNQGMVIVDAEGRVHQANDRFAQFLGLQLGHPYQHHAVQVAQKLRTYYGLPDERIQGIPTSNSKESDQLARIYTTTASQPPQQAESEVLRIPRNGGSASLASAQLPTNQGPDPGSNGPSSTASYRSLMQGLPIDQLVHMFQAIHGSDSQENGDHPSSAGKKPPTTSRSQKASTFSTAANLSQDVTIHKVLLGALLEEAMTTGRAVRVDHTTSKARSASAWSASLASPRRSADPEKVAHGDLDRSTKGISDHLDQSTIDGSLEDILHIDYENYSKNLGSLAQSLSSLTMLYPLSFPRDVLSTPVEVTVVPLPWHPQQSMSPLFAVMVHDLTMTLTAEGAQRRLDQKAQFFSFLSHEMRTPLTGITGALELFQATALDDDQRTLLELFEFSSRSLHNLLDNILEFSKLEAQRVVLDLRSHEFHGVMGPFVNAATRWAHTNGVHFTADIDPRIPSQLVMDDQRLFQILTNLISNAFKFTRRDILGNGPGLATMGSSATAAEDEQDTGRDQTSDDEGQVTLRVRLLVDYQQQVYERGPPLPKDHVFQAGGLPGWSLATAATAAMTSHQPSSVGAVALGVNPSGGGWSWVNRPPLVLNSQALETRGHRRMTSLDSAISSASGLEVNQGLGRDVADSSTIGAGGPPGHVHPPQPGDLLSPPDASTLRQWFDPAIWTPSLNTVINSPNPVQNSCRLLFEVIDNGIGISEENQAKLFQEYSQADRNTNRRYGGTGIGLYISRQLVELFGGQIGVKSCYGQGSRFYFTVWFQRDPLHTPTTPLSTTDSPDDYFKSRHNPAGTLQALCNKVPGDTRQNTSVTAPVNRPEHQNGIVMPSVSARSGEEPVQQSDNTDEPKQCSMSSSCTSQLGSSKIVEGALKPVVQPTSPGLLKPPICQSGTHRSRGRDDGDTTQYLQLPDRATTPTSSDDDLTSAQLEFMRHSSKFVETLRKEARHKSKSATEAHTRKTQSSRSSHAPESPRPSGTMSHPALRQDTSQQRTQKAGQAPGKVPLKGTSMESNFRPTAPLTGPVDGVPKKNCSSGVTAVTTYPMGPSVDQFELGDIKKLPVSVAVTGLAVQPIQTMVDERQNEMRYETALLASWHCSGPGPFLRPDQVRILMAEDDHVNRAIMGRHLHYFGFTHVDVVWNGELALKLFRENWQNGLGYHFVLLDMYMPVMNGIDVAEEIHVLTRRGQFMSGSANQDDGTRFAVAETHTAALETSKRLNGTEENNNENGPLPVLPLVVGITADVDVRLSTRHHDLLSSILIKPFNRRSFRSQFERYVQFD
ncbi:hypothetical protein IWQ62_000943 [Dispira parvispora]|uniref:histidine kinase n=1 Tax=Dispira parvispora TaxID=1520584 RepID=A0A9W8AW35_9FUNG|nr:hypothetical protein IWQ62_000943 [Dispira parvispora]